MKKTILGIDIGKQTLYFSDVHGKVRGEAINDGRGFRKIKRIITENHIDLVVLEASGGYEQSILIELVKEGFSVAIVDPTRVRNHARAAGKLAKTDNIDAKIIAHFGFCHQPRPFVLGSENHNKLRSLGKRRRQLIKSRTQEKCRRDRCLDEISQDSIERMISILEAEVGRIDSLMEALIQQDVALQQKSQLLETCPAVGKGSAAILLAECPELGSLNRKEIASLAGLAPMNRDSGSYQGKRFIQKGRKYLRNALYMVVLSGQIHNPYIRSMFERLREKGKPAKVALVACMRKVLTQLNAMIRDGKPWDLEVAKGKS